MWENLRVFSLVFCLALFLLSPAQHIFSYEITAEELTSLEQTINRLEGRIEQMQSLSKKQEKELIMQRGKIERLADNLAKQRTMLKKQEELLNEYASELKAKTIQRNILLGIAGIEAAAIGFLLLF